MDYLPAGLRHAYVWVIQGIIALLEGIRRGGFVAGRNRVRGVGKEIVEHARRACRSMFRHHKVRISSKMIVGEKPTKVFNTDVHWEPKE